MTLNVSYKVKLVKWVKQKSNEGIKPSISFIPDTDGKHISFKNIAGRNLISVSPLMFSQFKKYMPII